MTKKTLLTGATIKDKVTKEVLTCIGNGQATKPDGSVEDLRDDVFYTVITPGIDTDVPAGYSIGENGELIKADLPATNMGDLKLLEILMAVPGHLIVSASASAGKVNILSYSPATDEFKKIIDFVDETDLGVVKLTDDLFLIHTVIVSDVSVKNEDDSVTTKISLDGARLSVFSAKKNAIVKYVNFRDNETYVPVTPTYIGVTDPEDENAVPSIQLIFESQAVIKDLDDEKDIRIIENVDETNVVRYFISSYGRDGDVYIERRGDFVLKGVGDRVTTVTEAVDGSILIKAGSVIYYTNDKGRRKVMNAPEVHETNGYDYLLECNTENNKLEFVLGDRNYNICKITSEVTDDRGPVVTVKKL